MAIAHSKLTAQGQISVPAEVRKRLGLGPGSVLDWDERGGEIVVRKAGRHTSADVHAALFGADPPAAPAAAVGSPTSPVDVKDAIRRHIRKRHARD